MPNTMVESNSDGSNNKRDENKRLEEGMDNNKTLPTSAKRPKSVAKNDNNNSGNALASVHNASKGFPPRPKVIEPHAKNFSGWEVISVELSALRDIIPRIRHEIRSYTISECQFIRELEKKLPATRSSGEVRLHLVMEQIERLRMHRRSALDELSRSVVRIAELESRKERASYDAGELYWNTRLNELENRYYAEMASPVAGGTASSFSTASLQSGESLPHRAPPTHIASVPPFSPRDPSFGAERDYHEYSRTVDEDEKDGRNNNTGTTQAQRINSATLAGAADKKPGRLVEYNQRGPMKHQAPAGASSASVPSALTSRDFMKSSESITEDASSTAFTGGNEETPLVSADPSQGVSEKSSSEAISYLGELLKGKSGMGQSMTGAPQENGKKRGLEATPSEIDMIISEAKDQLSKDKRKIKKLLTIFGIPAAALIGLLFLEMQNHVLSDLISNLPR